MLTTVLIFFNLCCFKYTSSASILDSLEGVLKESDEQLLIETIGQRPLLDQYDFIIVGSGTAGSALAGRLSEIPQWKILLIEAGGFEKFVMDIPILVGKLQNTEVDWAFKTFPSENYCQAYENNSCSMPRGKVLGGSSILNYMITTRANRRDYDGWAELGNPGWAYRDLLPYHIKVENMTVPEFRNNPVHGTKGPVQISQSSYRSKLGDAFIQAGRDLGHRVGDHNGGSQTVFGYCQFNQDKRGRRESSSRAYIYPILRERENLHILVNAFVTRLILNGNKAEGVVVDHRHKTIEIRAEKEIIVSAGTMNSPQILMLSGIGPKSHLESLGIPVKADLPVGRHFQDHVNLGAIIFTTNITDRELNESCIINDPRHLVNYIIRGKGPYLIPGHNEALFMYDTKSPNDPDGYPEIELVFSSITPAPESTIRGFKQHFYDLIFKPIENIVTWAAQIILLRPKSRGFIRLASKDPRQQVDIIPNYFDDEYDVKTLIKGIRKTEEINRTPAFKKFNSQLIKARVPGCEGKTFDSDEYWICVMKVLTVTNHHQVGTCTMAPYGVVNERLKVHGFENLRVVDASIIPNAPAAHTNFPVLVVAEKAADLIKQDNGY